MRRTMREVVPDLYKLSIAHAFPSQYKVKRGILYWDAPRESEMTVSVRPLAVGNLVGSKDGV